MQKYWKIVERVIKESDILIVVLDARNIDYSRNKEIEKKIRQVGKKIIYVINKMDLVHPKQASSIRLKPAVKVSAKLHMGNMALLRELSRISKGKLLTVGVLGYPNTGKSSIINSLKGKASTGVSSISGYTKSMQKIRVAKNIVLLDTPGVFPRSEFDEIKHTLIGAKDFHKLKDVESIAAEIIERLDGKIETYFRIKKTSDGAQALEKIALKKNFLKKGKEPDAARAAKDVISGIQKGKIKL